MRQAPFKLAVVAAVAIAFAVALVVVFGGSGSQLPSAEQARAEAKKVIESIPAPEGFSPGELQSSDCCYLSGSYSWGWSYEAVAPQDAGVGEVLTSWAAANDLVAPAEQMCSLDEVLGTQPVSERCSQYRGGPQVSFSRPWDSEGEVAENSFVSAEVSVRDGEVVLSVSARQRGIS